MKVSDIVKKVQEYLDEMPAVNNMVEMGSAPIDDRIKALIPECAVACVNGKAIDEAYVSTFKVTQSGVGVMDVPADYGGLRELRLSCWHRSVYVACDELSPLYLRQQNLVTRGGVYRPVVAIVPYGEHLRMEMYSVPVWDSRVKVERAYYAPVPEIVDDDSEVDVMPNRESLLCYAIAVRVARSYGNEKAVALLSSSLEEEQTKMRIII